MGPALILIDDLHNIVVSLLFSWLLFLCFSLCCCSGRIRTWLASSDGRQWYGGSDAKCMSTPTRTPTADEQLLLWAIFHLFNLPRYLCLICLPIFSISRELGIGIYRNFQSFSSTHPTQSAAFYNLLHFIIYSILQWLWFQSCKICNIYFITYCVTCVIIYAI